MLKLCILKDVLEKDPRRLDGISKPKDTDNIKFQLSNNFKSLPVPLGFGCKTLTMNENLGLDIRLGAIRFRHTAWIQVWLLNFHQSP